MKFRDPETGRVFESPMDAIDYVCPNKTDDGKMCKICVLHNADEALICTEFAEAHPAEAARLMGLEVIKEEYNMESKKKPLSEWTLGEVKEMCRAAVGENPCDGCLFEDGDTECLFLTVGGPENWNLDDGPRFSEEDVAIVRAIKSAYPWANYIVRASSSLLYLESSLEFSN